MSVKSTELDECPNRNMLDEELNYDKDKEDLELPPFSVLLATYKNDTPEHLDASLNSVFSQTLSPNEVVIVQDGPLPQNLSNTLSRWQSEYPSTIRTVKLSQNQGLGKALQIGVEACNNELIARMDADDVAISKRFEIQIAYMVTHPNIDVLGGYIAEFDSDPNEILSRRTVPVEPDKISQFARFYCPMNHPTVAFRRSAVLSAGNYSDRRVMQDYELWVNMLNRGAKLANIPKVLVKMRTGESLFNRRGGLEYLESEIALFDEFRSLGFINIFEFMLNIAIRIPIRLLPVEFRRRLYRSLLRSGQKIHSSH